MSTLAVRSEREEPITPSLPPGPSSPALWQVIQLWRRPREFLERCRRRYGDAFTLRFPAMPPEVFVSDPAAVRDLFTGDSDVMRAGEANVILEPILGRNSLLLLDGARHLRERRLMMPPFHGERMHQYQEIISEITRETMRSWPIGRPFPVQPQMQRITLDVILRAVFGVDDAARVAELRHRLTRLLAVGTNPTILASWLQIDLGPLSPWGRYVRVRRAVHELLLGEISRRRVEGTAGRVDVLSMLLEARDEDGQPMSDEELRDEMITLLLAGHETTATALSWTFGRLVAHPEVLARLEADVDSGEIPYLDATIRETLRLHPVIPEVGRRLKEPAQVGRWVLPEGIVVTPSVYLIHRRPDLWPDPEEFRPDRFLDRRPSPYEFLPFGGGVRRCLGMAFALYEMRIVLAAVLKSHTVRAVKGHRTRTVRRSITLAPSGGMPIILERRGGGRGEGCP